VTAIRQHVMRNGLKEAPLRDLWPWAVGGLPTHAMYVAVIGLNTVYFSPNLQPVAALDPVPRRPFIVRIQPRVFLVEGAEALPLYLCSGKPLFNVDGMPINGTYPFVARSHAIIDVSLILFAVIACGSRKQLPLWQLLQQTRYSEDAPQVLEVDEVTYNRFLYTFISFFEDGTLKTTTKNEWWRKAVKPPKEEFAIEFAPSDALNGGRFIHDLFADSSPRHCEHEPFSMRILGGLQTFNPAVNANYNAIVSEANFEDPVDA